MAEEQTNRRLAAVLAADVVGYSRMMGADEAGTLAALKRHRETVFDPAVARHSGRVVKLIGDGTLAEFGSVVDAVKCAVTIQTATASDTSEPKIVLRIGINLGDVIIDDDDIYGDGVNVAARLEPLAEPGGVCIASIVNESVGSRVDVAFRDGGEVSVKNIDRPIRVWKWHPQDAAAAAPAPAAAPSNGGVSAEPDTVAPSIAVLPFDNMSGDPEQEYFSDGITEDIITDLSKVASLKVIARNSSFAYKGRSVDIRVVGRDLGVTSVLEGSIRRAGNRVRITAQLIDTGEGSHVWAERYDRDLTDIFAVQDEVTKHIVEALKVTLTPSERARIDDNPTTNVEAHDLFLRGRELMSAATRTRQTFEEARALYERAIALDPDYGEAYAGLALAHGLAYNNVWTDDLPGTLRHADELAMRAVELAPNDSYCNYVLSMTAAFSRDYERSKTASDRALAINPNDSGALLSRGALQIFAGDPADGIADIERAVELDPVAAPQHLHFLGLAHLMLGHYETAAAHFRQRILASPQTDLTRAVLASALGHLGEIDEARRVWRELKEINPDYSFTVHMNRLPFRNPADTDRIAQGLAKASLPD